MGEVRSGDQKVRKHLFSEILYGRQAVFYEDFFQELFGLEGSKNLLENFVSAQSENLEPPLTIQEFFSKNIPGFICSVCVPFLGS